MKRKKSGGVSNTIKNQTKVEKEQKGGKVNAMNKGGDNIDRISELPESIIHKILSHLRCPKDVARISVLSKRWRNIWTSFLTFDFDQKSFQQGQDQKENFKNFVENSISNRLNLVSCIEKFRVCMTSFDSKLAICLNRWINAATSRNVKDLEIHIDVLKKCQKSYSLPQTIFTAKTLTSLKLFGCRFGVCSDLKLPHLRQLSIKMFRIDVLTIQSFIHGCPVLEDLRLIGCSGLEYLHISTLPRLNRVEVHECHGLKWVKIESPNLHIFWYHRQKYSISCKLNLSACENLKSLTLKDDKITDELFQVLISKFTVLDSLVLMECHSLKSIIIYGQKLMRLALVRCKNLEAAYIDTPILSSFEYTGFHMPFCSMNTSSLLEAKICFVLWKTHHQDQTTVWSDMVWSDMLKKFLKGFDPSKGFKLVERFNKNVIVHEELSEMWFPLSNNLKLDIIRPSMTLQALADNLVQTYHPETLSIVSSSNSEFQKILYEKIMKRKKNPRCCRYYSRKCWRHYLENVEVDISKGAINERTLTWNPWLRPSPTLHQMTSFKFEWRSQE